MLATVIHRPESGTRPNIRVTIVNGKHDVSIRISDAGGGLGLPSGNKTVTPEDLFSFSHARNATRLDNTRLSALRDVSLAGVKGTVEEQIAKWGSPTLSPNVNVSRIGIGLPMSNIFAT